MDPRDEFFFETSSKAAKHAVECGCYRYLQDFLNIRVGFPKFKKKDIFRCKDVFCKE